VFVVVGGIPYAQIFFTTGSTAGFFGAGFFGAATGFGATGSGFGAGSGFAGSTGSGVTCTLGFDLYRGNERVAMIYEYRRFYFCDLTLLALGAVCRFAEQKVGKGLRIRNGSGHRHRDELAI